MEKPETRNQKPETRKSVVVAGNGPSLKDIDYSRLPKEFDVFRCNQFFFEEKYYLGKNIDKVFFGGKISEAMCVSYVTLKIKKEYNIDGMYNTVSFFDDPNVVGQQEQVKRLTIVKLAYDVLMTNEKIREFLSDRYVLFNSFPTTGMIGLLMAIAEGYTDIYIVGIDMYIGDNLYVYSQEQGSNLNQVVSFDVDPYIFHSRELEEQCLDFVKTFDDVTIHTISPNHVLQDIFPLAPVQNDIPYVPEDKPEGFLNDIVFSKRQQKARQQREKQQQEELKRKEKENKGKTQKLKQKFDEKGLTKEWEFLRNFWLTKFLFQSAKFVYVCLKVVKSLLKK